MLTEQELDQLADRVIMRMNPQVNKDNVFHNTKLLLDNYHKLKAHVATVNEQLNEDANTFWGHHHLNLNSLMQNKAKTVKLMKHVDESIETYRRLCNANCSRGYALIYQKYLADCRRTDENIAYDYNISRQAVNKQLKEALYDLSIILYGVDAL